MYKRLMREGDMRKAPTDRKPERDAAPTVGKRKEPAPELKTDELDRVVGGRGNPGPWIVAS